LPLPLLLLVVVVLVVVLVVVVLVVVVPGGAGFAVATPVNDNSYLFEAVGVLQAMQIDGWFRCKMESAHYCRR